MTDYSLTEEQWKALSKVADLPGGRGEDFVLACNADPDTDSIHTRRVGFAGSKLRARAVVAVRNVDDDGEETFAVGYLSAAEARQLGAALLNVADDIDGVAPLVFFPPDAPEIEEPAVASVIPAEKWQSALAVGSLVTVIGNGDADSGVLHYFDIGQVVEVVHIKRHSDGDVSLQARSLTGDGLVQFVAPHHLAPYTTGGNQ